MYSLSECAIHAEPKIEIVRVGNLVSCKQPSPKFASGIGRFSQAWYLGATHRHVEADCVAGTYSKASSWPVLTVFGRRDVSTDSTMIEMSDPSWDKMGGGKNHDSDEVDGAEYFHPCRHAPCRCDAGGHAGITVGLVI